MFFDDGLAGFPDGFGFVSIRSTGMDIFLELSLCYGQVVLWFLILLKRTFPTLFTRSSVHCAARMVATKSSSGVFQSSVQSAPGYFFFNSLITCSTVSSLIMETVWQEGNMGEN